MIMFYYRITCTFCGGFDFHSKKWNIEQFNFFAVVTNIRATSVTTWRKWKYYIIFNFFEWEPNPWLASNQQKIFVNNKLIFHSENQNAAKCHSGAKCDSIICSIHRNAKEIQAYFLHGVCSFPEDVFSDATMVISSAGIIHTASTNVRHCCVLFNFFYVPFKKKMCTRHNVSSKEYYSSISNDKYGTLEEPLYYLSFLKC